VAAGFSILTIHAEPQVLTGILLAGDRFNNRCDGFGSYDGDFSTWFGARSPQAFEFLAEQFGILRASTKSACRVMLTIDAKTDAQIGLGISIAVLHVLKIFSHISYLHIRFHRHDIPAERAYLFGATLSR
jgi:hypothetical protein